MWLYLYKSFFLSLTQSKKKKTKIMVTVAVFSLQYESSSFFTVSRHANKNVPATEHQDLLSFVSTSLLCLKKKKTKITAKITFTNMDVAPILA